MTLAAIACVGSLEPLSNLGPVIWGRLATLLFIAVLLERSLEIIVTTWRGPGAQERELEKNKWSSNKDSDEYKAAVKELNNYKNQTQRRSLWFALGLGLLISAAGIRTVEQLVVDLTGLNGFQIVLFRAMDILLTGGLIAGGSDAFHHLIQVYTNFMSVTSEKIKKASSN